jgi:uncharacterized paraquat-inducible protein A
VRLCERCNAVEESRPAVFCAKCGKKIHWVWKLPYPLRAVASVALLIGGLIVAVLMVPFNQR